MARSNCENSSFKLFKLLQDKGPQSLIDLFKGHENDCVTQTISNLALIKKLAKGALADNDSPVCSIGNWEEIHSHVMNRTPSVISKGD